MRGSKLAFLLVAAAAAVLPSCLTVSISQIQKRLDTDYAGGCLQQSQFGRYVQLVGFLANAGPDNVHYRYFDTENDEFFEDATLISYSVPGVPRAIAKCLDDFGIVSKIAVLTTDGQVHVIETLDGSVTTIGSSDTLFPIGVEFAAGAAPGLKNIIAYGQGGGPFSAVKVFVDEGDGTYSVGGFPAGLGSVSALALLDIDDDDDEDVVMALDAGGSNVRTAIYDGASTYAAGPSYAVPGTIGAIATEDLDGDGDRDVVVASEFPLQPATVSVFANNADGTLTQTDTETAGSGASRIAFGDLNADGHPDAGVVNGIDDTLTILFGTTGVAFDGDSTHLLPDGVSDIAFADIGAFGFAGVGVAVFSVFEDVGVFIPGDGQDLLSEQLARLIDTIGAVDFEVADLDDPPDGILEIAALTIPADTGSLPYDLYTLRWDAANNTFEPAGTPLSVNVTGRLAQGDLDGVNGIDLAAASPAGGVEVLLNDGAGNFSLATKTIDTGFFPPIGIAFAEIDDEPGLDAVIAYGGNIGVWFNGGDGEFTAGPTTAEPATAMAMGFDADQTARAALVHTALSVINIYAFLSDGTPTMTDSVDIAPIEDVSTLAAGDWDGDGDDDFVAISNDDPSRPVYIVVLENAGGGQFAASTLFTGQRADGWNIVSATITDLEGDGPGEVVFVNNGADPQDQFLGVISQSRARGAKQVEPIESYLAGEPSGGVAVADLSGDGRPWALTGKSGLLAGVSALPSWMPLEPGGCNDADLDVPFGVLDFSDVLAFLTAFGTMDPVADLAVPVGVFDFSDVLAFLTAFGAGCP
ncbi:MAG: VCBS repeat-containing protein [Phycisphaerales bacterium]